MHKLTTSKLDSLKNDFEALKEENQTMKDTENELKQAKTKLTKVEEECQQSSEYKKKYELTKSICLELEDQVKEYEVVIEKLEKMQKTLKESNRGSEWSVTKLLRTNFLLQVENPDF